jgi:hypothetical protein
MVWRIDTPHRAKSGGPARASPEVMSDRMRIDARREALSRDTEVIFYCG